MTGNRQRVLPDEEVLEGVEAIHRVAGAGTDHSLIGFDTDDGRRKRPTRNRVPGGVERRIERLDEAIEPDGGDLHARVRPGDGNTPPVSPNVQRGVTIGSGCGTVSRTVKPP